MHFHRFRDDPNGVRSLFLNYLRTRRHMFCRMLTRLRFSAADADEAFTEALSRVGRVPAHKLERVRNMDAWLRKVVIRAGLTILGQQNARAKRFCPLSFDPATCPCEQRDRAEAIEVLVAAILQAADRLPAPLRGVFRCCVVEQRPLREAAALLGLRKFTVNRRRNKAIRLVREMLGIDPENPAVPC